jgi:hypothetical protein
MAPRYRYSRMECIQQMEEDAWGDGRLRLMDVVALLLAEVPTDRDVAWALQKSRQHRFIDTCMPIDPRMEQILALDT